MGLNAGEVLMGLSAMVGWSSCCPEGLHPTHREPPSAVSPLPTSQPLPPHRVRAGADWVGGH